MARRWSLVAGVVVAVVAWIVWAQFRDTSTPVSSDQVAGGFVGTVGDVPGDPGIYRYATSGHEAIDALAGARHDYPELTFMTITLGSCGPTARWDALDERWINWRHCGEDLAIDASDSYHEWFGIPDLEEEVCAVPRPISGQPGSSTTTVCQAAGSTETYETEIVGLEVLPVAGMDLETVHLRRVSTLSAGSTGIAEVEVWRLVDSPLIVRMVVERTSVTSSVAGDVTYEEVFELELLDPFPQG